MFQFFEDQLNGTLGCLFLVGLFSVMWVTLPSLSILADFMSIHRFYGFTCGQVMYYLTNYCVPDEPTHITTLVCTMYSDVAASGSIITHQELQVVLFW